MWSQSIAPWLLTVAIVSQVGAGPAAAAAALPELHAARKQMFAIPFRIERSNDPAWQPVEALLYVSVDRGAHWRQYAKATADKNQFTFRAGGDGEYWFAIRTADRSGKARPASINGPGLRVLVDTKPPVVKLTAQPGKDGQVTVRWAIDEPNLDSKTLNIVYRPSPTEPWQAVTIARDRSDSLQRGEATFWPKPGSTEIPIRAEVSDTAGNPAVANIQAKLNQQVGPRPADLPDAAAPSSSNENQDRPPRADNRKDTAPISPFDNQDRPTPADPPRSNDAPGDVGPALTPDSNDAAVGAAPPVARQVAMPGGSSDGGPTMPAPALGERPRMVNSRTFELEYDVDSVGSSGIGRVELWGTQDGGQTWRSFAVDSDKRSPLQVSVKEEGTYGFRVVVTNGAGFGGKPPVAGDPPDLTIGVDQTKPTAQIVSAKQGADAESGQLIITWQADDQMLAARPISISFSENRSGPWSPIAAGLENTNRYAWPIDNRTPGKIYLRLEVRDEAGNVATGETTDPVMIDQSHPTVRIRSVRPISQPGRSALRPR